MSPSNYPHNLVIKKSVVGTRNACGQHSIGNVLNGAENPQDREVVVFKAGIVLGMVNDLSGEMGSAAAVCKAKAYTTAPLIRG